MADTVSLLAPRLALVALVLLVLKLRPWRWVLPYLRAGRG